ncbi:hypothetical protein ACFX1R_047522 [Malus domestica]
MSWFFTVIFLVTARTFHTPSKASHEKNDPSTVVVGTVYCDICFQEDFSHSSHFISGKLISNFQQTTSGRDIISLEEKLEDMSFVCVDIIVVKYKAHVQQVLATEDALNKAAGARDLYQKLIKRLHGNSDVISSGTSQNVGSLRQLELEVWVKEREVAGLRASLNTLMSEIQRLNKLCAERKEAEDSLKKKWKKIEEFGYRRSELEIMYTSLLKVNMDAAAFWNQQPLAAREYASSTIIPACTVVMDLSNSAKDLIEREVSAFDQSPDNSLYMLPATPQALLESMGTNGSTGPEVVAAAEKNAAILTAKAGARDPSAIPSIYRISAALQYPGLEGSDAALLSILESLEFCLKLRGSEASVLEDLAKAINLVHTRQDLVESGHVLLNHAYRAQQEYDR